MHHPHICSEAWPPPERHLWLLINYLITYPFLLADSECFEDRNNSLASFLPPSFPFYCFFASILETPDVLGAGRWVCSEGVTRWLASAGFTQNSFPSSSLPWGPVCSGWQYLPLTNKTQMTWFSGQWNVCRNLFHGASRKQVLPLIKRCSFRGHMFFTLPPFSSAWNSSVMSGYRAASLWCESAQHGDRR